MKHLSEDNDDPFFGRWDKAAQYSYQPARLTCFLSDHFLKIMLNFFASFLTVLLRWFIWVESLILNHSKCIDAHFWVRFGTSLPFCHSSIALSQAQAFLAEHLCPMLFTVSFLSSSVYGRKRDRMAQQYRRVRLKSTHHNFWSWAPCLFLCFPWIALFISEEAKKKTYC